MKKATQKISIVLLILSITAGTLFLTPVGQQVRAAGTNVYLKLKILTDIVGIINEYYVEVPDWDKVVDKGITGMMESLDPHSVYIKEDKLSDIQEQFEGKFEGIGIEFDILGGYITVIAPIANSPADRAGLQAGDKIIKIDGESAHKITRKKVFNQLRGPRGSEVQVTIKRPGTKNFEVTIIRDEIPIYSVSAAFMLDDSTGYIYLNRFSETTTQEMEDALRKLQAQQMQRLILDLRNNSGGLLQQAVKVADIFIQGKQQLVYTKGRHPSVNEEFYSGKNDAYQPFPLVIMINRGSASASEIVSGAVQDLDRGIIIGETSFGKGLVQRQYTLRDESAIRVTVARYYTPSGRLIQRPYNGDLEDYYESFGVVNRDSLLAAQDSLEERPQYHTQGGRVVYGGGGITPDHFVPYRDSLTTATQQLLRDPGRILFEFASDYSARHPQWTEQKDQFMSEFMPDSSMFRDLTELIQSKELEFDSDQLQQDRHYILTILKAEMAKDYWGKDEYYQILRQNDNQVAAAMTHLDEAQNMVRGYADVGQSINPD